MERASLDSVIHYDGEKSINGRYAISLYIEGTRNLNELAELCDLPDDSNLWLSWTMFDRTIQSEEFVGFSNGIEPYKDTLNVSCTENALMEQFPLRIYLCTAEKIIAVTEVGPHILRGNILRVPLQVTDWIVFSVENEQTNAALQVTITIDDITPPRVEEITENLLKTVVNRPTLTDHRPHATLDEEIQVPSSHQQVPEEEAVFVDEHVSVHYRFSVDVRSIGAMKRAAHVITQFNYPHFGSNAHVRSLPMWVRSAVEAKLEGGTATYDFCMTRGKFEEIVSTFPLQISVSSKTNLGNEPFGEVKIDLYSLLNSKVHSVRCPITNRVFKRKEEYTEYRAQLIDQQHKKSAIISRDSIPPLDPIVIRVVDSYYDVVDPYLPQQQSGSTVRKVGNARVAKIRVLMILEEVGTVLAPEYGISVKPGYKMHNAAVYETNGGREEGPLHTQVSVGLPAEHAKIREEDGPTTSTLDHLKDENFELLLEVERAQMRKKIEMEMVKSMSSRADDLRRAQEENGKLELKLRATLEAAERQKNQLIVQEEQINMKMTQKSHELQLLQKRVKEDATIRIEAEQRKSVALQLEVDRLKDDLKKERARSMELDAMYEKLRNQVKGMPEMALRDEITKLKSQIADSRAELERTKRLKAEADCEKTHFKAQMHRLALALKREREKNTALARQDIEQLRLEYLAREERFVLDGDREELAVIRNELSRLRGVVNSSENVRLEQKL